MSYLFNIKFIILSVAEYITTVYVNMSWFKTINSVFKLRLLVEDGYRSQLHYSEVLTQNLDNTLWVLKWEWLTQMIQKADIKVYNPFDITYHFWSNCNIVISDSNIDVNMIWLAFFLRRMTFKISMDSYCIMIISYAINHESSLN